MCIVCLERCSCADESLGLRPRFRFVTSLFFNFKTVCDHTNAVTGVLEKRIRFTSSVFESLESRFEYNISKFKIGRWFPTEHAGQPLILHSQTITCQVSAQRVWLTFLRPHLTLYLDGVQDECVYVLPPPPCHDMAPRRRERWLPVRRANMHAHLFHQTRPVTWKCIPLGEKTNNNRNEWRHGAVTLLDCSAAFDCK